MNRTVALVAALVAAMVAALTGHLDQTLGGLLAIVVLYATRTGRDQLAPREPAAEACPDEVEPAEAVA